LLSKSGVFPVSSNRWFDVFPRFIGVEWNLFPNKKGSVVPVSGDFTHAAALGRRLSTWFEIHPIHNGWILIRNCPAFQIIPVRNLCRIESVWFCFCRIERLK